MKYFLLLFLFASTYIAQIIDTNKIDSFINKTRERLNLQTGFSISVVVKDSIIYKKGYGYIDIDNKTNTTSETPFYIASATKSFVAALNKILMNEKVIDIDEPISTYLPDFKFQTKPLDTETISIRDLLTHKHGIVSLPAVLRTAFTGDYTKEKLFELYQNAEFTGVNFKYSNDGYVFNSLILEKVTGKTWQNLLEEKIFIPLEMNNTSSKVSDYTSLVLPKAYSTINGEIRELPFLKEDKTMHAAGGIISTAEDLSNWLIFNLGNEEFNSKKILPKSDLDEIHSAQVNCEKTFWKYNRYSYGLGWYLSDYNGETLIHHFGGYTGAKSHISFMPEYKIGIVALTNDEGDGYYLTEIAADYVYNLFTGKDADQIAEEELKIILNNQEEANSVEKEEKSKIKSDWNSELLVGEYYSEDFGQVVINENLHLKFGNLNGDLIPSDNKKFICDLKAFRLKVEFTEEDGKVIELILHGPTSLVFQKVK